MPKEIHEQYEVQGKLGELTSEVLHFSTDRSHKLPENFFNYSISQAKEYKKINKKYGARELLLNPLHMF